MDLCQILFLEVLKVGVYLVLVGEDFVTKGVEGLSELLDSFCFRELWVSGKVLFY